VSASKMSEQLAKLSQGLVEVQMQLIALFQDEFKIAANPCPHCKGTGIAQDAATPGGERPSS
jgi:hypothetical protein